MRLPLARLAALLASLALAPPARGATPVERQTAAAELADLAPRIEALKRQVAEGRGGQGELPALLRRAQELAARAEPQAAASPPARPGSADYPDAEELRERADHLRDEADRVVRRIAEVDRRIAELRRQADLSARLDALDDDLFADAASRRRAQGAAPTGPLALPGVGTVSGAGARPPLEVAGAGRAAPADGPDPADDAAALRHKRAGLAAALAELRSRAEALEAAARALP